MTLKVKFDRILGRLREKDGSGDTPTPPVTHTFTATTIGSSKSYYADQQETGTLSVTVELRYDGNLVDADTVPSGWEKVPNTTGQYTKTISGSGSTGATTFSYTANGETKTANAQSKTLTKVWPAYWGMVATNDTNTGIDAIADDLANNQHRETASFSNRLIDVEGDPKKDMWLWVMVRNSATVVDATFNTSVVNAPVNLAAFESPKNANIELSGYKAYVTTWPIEANVPGYQAKLSITL